MRADEACILIGIDRAGNPSVIKHADAPVGDFEVEVKLTRTYKAGPAIDLPARRSQLSQERTERLLLSAATRGDYVRVTGWSRGNHYTGVKVWPWQVRVDDNIMLCISDQPGPDFFRLFDIELVTPA